MTPENAERYCEELRVEIEQYQAAMVRLVEQMADLRAALQDIAAGPDCDPIEEARCITIAEAALTK